MLFLDEKGKEISRLLGFIGVEEMTARMGAGRRRLRGRTARPSQAATTRPPWRAPGATCSRPATASDAERLLAKALRKAPAAERESIELDLARAELAVGDSKKAAKRFAALAESGSSREVKAAALEGLAAAEEQHGHAGAALMARERLKKL